MPGGGRTLGFFYNTLILFLDELEHSASGFRLSSSVSLASMDSSGMQSVPSSQDLTGDPTSSNYKVSICSKCINSYIVIV